MSDQSKPPSSVPLSPAPKPKPSAQPVPTPSKSSPVFGLALLIGIVALGIVAFKLPFEGDPSTVKRIGITCISLFIGLLIYSMARGLIEAVLKAVVEVIAAAMFLLDALAVTLVILWRQPITDWAVRNDFGDDNAFWVLAVFMAIVLFIINAVVFLLLHPLSKVVGTEIEIR